MTIFRSRTTRRTPETGPSPDELCERLEAQLLDVDRQRRELAALTLVATPSGDVVDRTRDVSQFVRLAELSVRAERLQQHVRAHQTGCHTGTVGIGSVVTVELDGEAETVLIGYAEEQQPPWQTVTPASPLGLAMLGRRQGETATFRRPDRREVPILVVEVRP